MLHYFWSVHSNEMWQVNSFMKKTVLGLVFSMAVNSWEISLLGLEARIPGLVRVSVWTVVIRLAKQWQ